MHGGCELDSIGLDLALDEPFYVLVQAMILAPSALHRPYIIIRNDVQMCSIVISGNIRTDLAWDDHV
jgi:hypothetical protein